MSNAYFDAAAQYPTLLQSIGANFANAYHAGRQAKLAENQAAWNQRVQQIELDRQAKQDAQTHDQNVAIQAYAQGDQKALDQYPMVNQQIEAGKQEQIAKQLETLGRAQTIQGNAFEQEQKRALTQAQLTNNVLRFASNPQAYANAKGLVETRFPDLFPAGSLPDRPPQGPELDAAKKRAIGMMSTLSRQDLTPIAAQISQSLGYGQGQEADALNDPKFHDMMSKYLDAEVEGKKKPNAMVSLGFSGNGMPQVLGANGRDEAFLATLPPEMRPMVTNIVEGKMAMPPTTTRGGQPNPVAAAVSRYEPGFDTTIFQQRQLANKDFSAGGKAGQSLGAFNLAMQHAGKLTGAIDQLNNGNTQLANRIENSYLEQRGDPRITRFTTIAHALAGEAGKIFRGTGQMTDTEQKAMDSVLDVNASRAQQIAAAQTLVELMSSRVDVLRSQWENAFRGTKPFSFVTPEAGQVLSKKFGISGSASETPTTATAPIPTAPQNQSAIDSGYIRITNGQQTGRVPAGTKLDPGWSVIE